jgi:outer membrane protein assembly factor BamB
MLWAMVGLQSVNTPVSAAATPPTYAWPVFHNGATLPGVSTDPGISQANASKLGVRWMAPLGASLGSPMVAWNATLQETLAYVGTSAGYFNAVNAATGQIVWSDYLGSSVISSPLVEGNYVWIAPTGGGRVYKLDSATGATSCTGTAGGSILSTPVIATPPGGQTTLYFASQGSGATDGLVYAFAEGTCAQLFTFNGYTLKGQDTGVWDPLSYAVDKAGEGLLVFGSANPDSSVYAVDAITGDLVWTYQTYSPATQDYDVGAGVDISAPGVNGFTDGAAYVEGKDGICYALNLTTGALYWQFNFGGNGAGQPPVTTDALSTPALSGTTLVFGDINGVYAVNATTGAQEWFFAGNEDVNSSPAIVGPSGSRVVTFGTLGHQLDVLRLSSGALLYQYTTGNAITSSPADVDGNLILDSEDGFMYDFAVGGGNGDTPSTAVTAPASGATVPNPNGSLTITGTASAPDGVSAVNVEVQENGSAGPWFSQSADSFESGLSYATATLTDPGADSSGWSLSIPIPIEGGSYEVLPSAVGSNGVADISALSGASSTTASSFTVSPSSAAPQLSAPSTRVSPGGTITVSGTKFAPSESLTFTIPQAGSGTITLGKATASSKGVVKATKLVIPTKIGFGRNSITAAGGASQPTASLLVYFANNDPQFGYGPLHDGYEANDRVLSSSQGTVGTPLLQLAWSLATAGPIDSTPAVVGGTVYVGDESGNLYAVDETSGNVEWSTAVGGAIESSPAVDSGLVIFGDDAGSLTALDAGTGSNAWSTPLSGEVRSAPAVVGGVVYVGSTTGVLYAVNEASGAIEWSYQLAGGVVSSPAADIAAGLVIVTDQSGAVTAVSTTGSFVWAYATGSAIDASPAVASGRVFVGSTNDTVYALDESSGALDWSATTDGTITATPGLIGTTVYVGSGNGTLYQFASATGKVLFSQPVGAPISGLALAQGFVVISSTNQTMEGLREPGGVRVAWSYDGAGSFASAPVVLNGDAYVGDGASQLLAFSALGAPMV